MAHSIILLHSTSSHDRGVQKTIDNCNDHCILQLHSSVNEPNTTELYDLSGSILCCVKCISNSLQNTKKKKRLDKTNTQAQVNGHIENFTPCNAFHTWGKFIHLNHSYHASSPPGLKKRAKALEYMSHWNVSCLRSGIFTYFVHWGNFRP